MRVALAVLAMMALTVAADQYDDAAAAFLFAGGRPQLPAGSKRFTPTKWTQEIATTDGRPRISKVPISSIASKWHQSGGMEGIPRDLWVSEKHRLWGPGGATTKIANISVRNSLGYDQDNRGIVQNYSDGTRFDDVLRNAKTGLVFEHRTRQKVNGKWRSRVVYSDPKQYPSGYTGLTVTCASCHDQAGTGSYNAGLVPGGDTVLSEELEWSLVE